MNLLLSIIIPIYNVEKHLKKCLNSIISQNFKDLEIILINDGSNDGSSEIAYEFAQKEERIKLINKINGGVSSARNLGLKHAGGKWIYFLDGDDYLTNHIIQNLSSILLSNQFDIILGNYNCVNIDDELFYSSNNNVFNKKGKDIILDYGLWRHKIVMGAYFVKRSLIIKNNLVFNEDSKYAEDTEFINYCLLNASNVISVKNIIFNYVKHNESAISHVSFSRFDVYKSKKRILDYIILNYPDLTKPKKMFVGFLLPEAVIDTVELLCKDGISLQKIKKHLLKHNYYDILSIENFNEYTPSVYEKKINLFINYPIFFWLLNYLKSKQYQLRVLGSNTLRWLKLYN